MTDISQPVILYQACNAAAFSRLLKLWLTSVSSFACKMQSLSLETDMVSLNLSSICSWFDIETLSERSTNVKII